VSGNDPLARRYRRLLAAYPADHRRLHGEEMVDVLLASARPGQRWPRLADAADLLAGALRIRLRRRPDRAGDPAWRDALAVVSLVVPLLMLAGSLTVFGVLGFTVRALTGAPAYGLPGPWYWAIALAPVAVALLALLGLRRSVALAALVTGTIPFVAVFAVSDAHFPSFGAWLWIDFAMLAAVAAWLSPGPRRGREILHWWGTGGAIVMLLVSTAVVRRVVDGGGPGRSLPVLLITVVAAMTAGACLTSRAGRRVLVLLAIPGLPALAFLLTLTGMTADWPLAIPSVLAALYFPAVLVVCLAALAARARGTRRKVPPEA
jgi:hypothetical protein